MPEPASDLFQSPKEKTKSEDEPLAARMRPRSLDEIVGQEHLLGLGKILRRSIEADRISSLILYGPPGCGKTALAHVIASRTQANVEQLNATSAGVAELRECIARAKQARKINSKRTILFVDEIHRFNKAQQDVLMPDVENGNVVLIGATTFNPFFAILPALVSRSLVCELKPLGESDIIDVLSRAISDKERGLGLLPVDASRDALAYLAKTCDGDARRALNAVELAVLTTPKSKGKIFITKEVIEESIQKKAVMYDRDEDAHYDTISAFIKSMRGSDPDAALYWLAKMIYAGEDPRFIARRIVICASEDVGNADPQALVVATAAVQASEFVGLPECRIILAHAAAYVACAPKSNAAYIGLEKATSDIKEGRTLEVPKHLKDAHYSGAKKLGRGIGYKYAHDFKGHYVKQDYIPEKKIYYEPTDIGFEKIIKERLEKLRKND